MNEPLNEVSKIRYLWHQNRGDGKLTGMSTEGTCLLDVLLACPLFPLIRCKKTQKKT